MEQAQFSLYLRKILQCRTKFGTSTFQCCSFSTSNVLNKKKPWRRYGYYEDRERYDANVPFTMKRKEIFLAQKKRRPSDYPLTEDQRASWKHSRWYDRFYNKWVDTLPSVKAHTFNLNYKEKRQMIFEEESLRNKLHLLLNIELRRKYIVPSFNMNFSRNASYYHQFLTNTKFVHGMPYCIHSLPLNESVLENFENFLTNYLQMEYFYNSNTANEKNRKLRSDRIVRGIVQYLMSTASASNPDLMDCEVDHNPENCMYWLRGRGFHKHTLPKDIPVILQTHDSPLCQIRTKNGLNAFTPWMEDFMLEGSIPWTDLTPYAYEYEQKSYKNMITPGIRYKAGDVEPNYQEALDEGKLSELPPPLTDPCLYGHTQFFSLPAEFDRKWYEDNLSHCDIMDQIEEHVKAHGIMSGWTWTAAQAHYMGHWMDHDIDKPLSIQTVITDGEYFSFFCYQLNTIAIDPDNADSNQKRNICFGTPFMKLFNQVEGTDDIELYREATELLLKFILNNSQVKTDRQEAINHNSTLQVQEWDENKPTIEEQKPKHVREQELAALQAQENLKEENPTLKEKLVKLVKAF